MRRATDRPSTIPEETATMTPVHMPATVAGHGWPILSAVRYGTSDTPAEFFVAVDCGEGTPTEPYATMHVYAWPDRTTFRDGEYNLTFSQAQRSMLERSGLLPTSIVEVVVVRDPDRANDYTIFIDGVHHPDGTTDRVRVLTHDIDPGAGGVTASWVADQLRHADDLSQAAAGHVRDLVTGYADDEGVEVAGE
jgi:hypothetical protein